MTSKDILLAIEQVFEGNRIAVVFRNDFKQRVRATKKFGGRVQNLVITIGPPNYRERRWLKFCKKHNVKPRKLYFPGKTGVVK